MKLKRYYHTIRHLRFRQVFYRMYYPIKKKLFFPAAISEPAIVAAGNFSQHSWFPTEKHGSFNPDKNTFHFLNLSYSFEHKIDWNFSRFGALWTYHLNYFDWLGDEKVVLQDRLKTIEDYIGAEKNELKTGRDPYPISLRGINWIQFLTSNKIKNKAINSFLYQDYQKLAAFPEYHIAGNHLLENAFSLFWGAHYFNNNEWFAQASKLLVEELNEQVLSDGAHFERSPMYHSILLMRLLQCIEMDLYSQRFHDLSLSQLMRKKASMMLCWLKAFAFKNGQFAMVGDSTPGMAPSLATLKAYATHLNIPFSQHANLNASGFRKVSGKNWEMIVNVGDTIASYQPGHAHADVFNFCLQVNDQPIIVDTGVSTYERNEQRLSEKSTMAHNSITVNGKNTSDVWASFRMGQRAKVEIIEENGTSVKASHDGYKHLGAVHQRAFEWEEEKIIINDALKKMQPSTALLYLHLHPDVHVIQRGETLLEANGIKIELNGLNGYRIEEYQYCEGFNRTRTAKKIISPILNESTITIHPCS